MRAIATLDFVRLAFWGWCDRCDEQSRVLRFATRLEPENLWKIGLEEQMTKTQKKIEYLCDWCQLARSWERRHG